MNTDSITSGQIGHNLWWVAASGEHDLTTSDDLRTSLDAALARGDVILDLSEATFIDSTVVGLVVERTDRGDADECGLLALVVPPDTGPAQMLRELHLDRFLTIFETRDDAIDSWADSAS
jgi:anti-anti-sigma factor